MKCLVLAGGSSDRLWPMSRKNYPKQFMEIRRGRSMFQEAILRNMPFCDDFVIVTNVRYEKVARAQLQVFQGLKYTLLLEETPLKTAVAVIVSALRMQPDEELLIVSTDHIIEGDYNSLVTRAKELVREEKLVVVGIKPQNRLSDYHFLDYTNKKITFTDHRSKHCYWDSGIFAAKASVILDSIIPKYLDLYRQIKIRDGIIEVNKSIPAVGLDKVWKNDSMELLEAQFQWTRITDISSYYRFLEKNAASQNVIQYKSKNVEVVNDAQDQLVVVNGLKDVLVANTRDAIYITGIDAESDVKTIANKYYQKFNKFFDERPVFYEKWGIREILNQTDHYSVSRITVFPNRALQDSVEGNYTLNYLVVEGTAGVSTPDKGSWVCPKNANVIFRENTAYEISNSTKRNLVMIQTRNIDKAVNTAEGESRSCYVKLAPTFKDYLWGGTKIRDVLGKSVGKMGCIAESWELSAHSAGQSKIASGKWKGMLFSDFIEAMGKEELGWKAQTYERFPLMVKLIDAKQNLSIQVHPDDEYAFSMEGDYGKNEMWYVMESDDDAFLYIGFNRDVTEAEVRERIENNTLTEVLNKVPVKKGETYFLQSGTVHAIGAGCFVCEIQQSSNVTYRMYDFGRKDKDGNPRELHIDKAMAVLNFSKSDPKPCTSYPKQVFAEYSKQLLGQCKYFNVLKYDVEGKLKIPPNDSTFQVVIVIEGEGRIGNGYTSNKTKFGDTWFFSCQDSIVIDGQCTVLITNI